MKVGIAGASGYTGAELIRLIDAHPAFELAWLGAKRAAGAAVADQSPGLHPYASVTYSSLDPDQMPELDLLFVAMPAGESFEFVRACRDSVDRLVDLGADFRHPDPAVYSKWYGGPERSADDFAGWTYGLTEAARDEIAASVAVANPGCYPTAALLALLPLVTKGLIGEGPVFVDGKSGVSGAGRSPADHLHFPEVFGDVSPYGLKGHRHLPEIMSGLERYSGGAVSAATNPVTFVPHLMPVARGLLASCFAPVAEGVEPGDVESAFRDTYESEAFVRVVDGPPHTKAVAGSNMALVCATPSTEGGGVVVTCAIDNLVKGAAGQAVQNANLMVGIEEGSGLSQIGLWP